MVSEDAFIEAILSRDIARVVEYMREQRQLAVEEALKVLPAVTHSLVITVARNKVLRDEFFVANKDLLLKKELFAQNIETIEGSNPGIEYKDLLARAADVTRRGIVQEVSLMSSPTRKPALEEIDPLLNMFEEKQ